MVQSKESKSESGKAQKQSESGKEQKQVQNGTLSTWHHIQKKKKNNRQLFGHIEYIPGRLCRNIVPWNNP